MWNRKISIGIAGAGVAATLLAAAAGHGGPAAKGDKGRDDNASSSVGFVDLNTISDEIKKTPGWQKMVQKATEKRATLSKELDEMVQRRHLTEAESKELDALRAKPKATDQETQRISKLLAKSDQIDAEFNQLANIQNLSPEQQTRLQELGKMRSEAGQRLAQARGTREKELGDLENSLLSDMQSQILKVVSDVAKAQNVEVIIDKQALLFGGRDLTSLVVQKLPKN